MIEVTIGFVLFSIIFAMWFYNLFAKPVQYYLNFVEAPPASHIDSIVKPNLFLTYVDKSSIPNKVWDGLRQYAKGFNIRFFDDAQCEEYLESHFHSKIVDRYREMTSGPHKADLWRYCALFREGGVYIDIKTVLTQSLQSIFPRDKNTTVMSHTGTFIHQGILSVPRPGDAVMRKCIAHVLRTPNRLVSLDYHVFTKAMYNFISESDEPWYLLQEVCSKDGDCVPDKYGLCCHIENQDGEVVFRTRYSDYPWHK